MAPAPERHRLAGTKLLVMRGPSGPDDVAGLIRGVSPADLCWLSPAVQPVADHELAVEHDHLGAPQLSGRGDLSLSCTRLDGLCAVALCAGQPIRTAKAPYMDGARLGGESEQAAHLPEQSSCDRVRPGIDLSRPGEFGPDYPYSRAFAPGELERAQDSLSALGKRVGDRALSDSRAFSAALCWALKEAAVKALGTGFHRFEPADVCVARLDKGQDGLNCQIRAGVLLQARASLLGDAVLALCVCPGKGAAQE